MNKADIETLVRNTIIKYIAKEQGAKYVPAAVSNSHIHLSKLDIESLFGKGYTLKQQKPLSQPDQYACEEKLTIAGLKAKIDGVRVLGPPREQTQVEISITDSYKIGIVPIIKMSGDLEGSAGAKIIGPEGSIILKKGVIVSKRHIHISNEQAKWMDVSEGQIVKIIKAGERAIALGNVVIRSGDSHSLELHIDTDEANAANIITGDILRMEL